VPQSDPRTLGFVIELSGEVDVQLAQIEKIPALEPLLQFCTPDPSLIYVLAANETPATSADTFFMRPHVDKRWLAPGFGDAVPRHTSVVFLDFPDEGRGGELVVFDNTPASLLHDLPREGGRAAAERLGAAFVDPIPGHYFRMEGRFPHAVLGYEAASQSARRLAIVVGAFEVRWGEPPARGLLPLLT